MICPDEDSFNSRFFASVDLHPVDLEDEVLTSVLVFVVLEDEVLRSSTSIPSRQLPYLKLAHPHKLVNIKFLDSLNGVEVSKAYLS